MLSRQLTTAAREGSTSRLAGLHRDVQQLLQGGAGAAPWTSTASSACRGLQARRRSRLRSRRRPWNTIQTSGPPSAGILIVAI